MRPWGVEQERDLQKCCFQIVGADLGVVRWRLGCVSEPWISCRALPTAFVRLSPHLVFTLVLGAGSELHKTAIRDEKRHHWCIS